MEFYDFPFSWEFHHPSEIILDPHGIPITECRRSEAGRRGDAKWLHTQNRSKTWDLMSWSGTSSFDPTSYTVITGIFLVNIGGDIGEPHGDLKVNTNRGKRRLPQPLQAVRLWRRRQRCHLRCWHWHRRRGRGFAGCIGQASQHPSWAPRPRWPRRPPRPLRGVGMAAGLPWA